MDESVHMTNTAGRTTNVRMYNVDGCMDGSIIIYRKKLQLNQWSTDDMIITRI